MENKATQKEIKKIMNKAHYYLIKIGANNEDAKDIVQQSFYKAMLYIDSIEADKLSSWIFKTSINHYYDLCKKQKREVLDSFEDDLADNKTLLDDLLLEKEEQSKINRVLQQLSPQFKKLLLMKYELELSYKEISQMLNMNPDTVKTYLARARKNFQEYYRRLDH